MGNFLSSLTLRLICSIAEAAKARELEKELNLATAELLSLRPLAKQAESLKEQLNSAKRQIEQLERSMREHAKDAVELEALRKKVADWERIVGNLDQYGSEKNFETLISDLQQQNVLLLDTTGTLKAEIARLQRTLESKDDEV